MKKIIKIILVMFFIISIAIAYAASDSPDIICWEMFSDTFCINGTSITHSITVQGNVTADYFMGNGSLLTGVTSTGAAGWNITGSNYLINNSGILDVNETKLNNTYLNLSGGNANQNIDIGDYNFTADYVDANLDWTNISDGWPTECPAGTAITKLNKSVTCTAFASTDDNALLGASGDSVFLANVSKNFGIGTTTPGEELDVVGDVEINGETDIIGTLTVAGKSKLGMESVSLDSGGKLVITYSFIRMDTYGGAATDTMNEISGGSYGDILIITGASSAHDTTITSTNNIQLAGGVSFVMDNARDSIMFIKTTLGTPDEWVEISRSNNA